jgi:hypothetical protein
MMKRMLGFWAGCAAAGVLTSPDSGISIDPPNKTAQDRKPRVLRGGVAINGGLAANSVLNMASLSLFMMRQWLLA